ncbi:MAG: DUF3105 domain-containing protein [Patescibacteria group bacterium]|nr:DUF3105 domain-containing protein [Patescibacteria group bacterium]
MNLDYPEEWHQLPKHERRKKIKELARLQNKKAKSFKKTKNVLLIAIIIISVVVGYEFLGKKNPKQMEIEQKTATVSLNGRVEEFSIEGRNHVPSGTKVDYKTNPPTSGEHLAEAENWGVYSKEIDDKAAVHGLEHGGIWISYKDLDEESRKILEQVGKNNPLSVIVSPRMANDDKIAIVSWGKMMRLQTADTALIQQYIETYKNQAPEKLAR